MKVILVVLMNGEGEVSDWLALMEWRHIRASVLVFAIISSSVDLKFWGSLSKRPNVDSLKKV